MTINNLYGGKKHSLASLCEKWEVSCTGAMHSSPPDPAGSVHATGRCSKWAPALFKWGETKTGPQRPQMGFVGIMFGCPGSCRAARANGRGAECNHCCSQGLAGTAVIPWSPKGTWNELWTPMGFSVLCHFSPKKRTREGAAAPQGHIWTRPAGIQLPRPPPLC